MSLLSSILCALLPIFERFNLFKQRNVSDLSIVGIGENEKQMLNPYAGAASSFWHINTLPRIRSELGGCKDNWGLRNSVCVCAYKDKRVGV